MNDGPFTKYTRGYATGVPVIGLGGLPDPYSMVGVLDREEHEHNAPLKAAPVSARYGLHAYPRVSRQRSDDLDHSR